jgi:hypothetical protein
MKYAVEMGLVVHDIHTKFVCLSVWGGPESLGSFVSSL